MRKNDEIFCNQCGKLIKVEEGIVKEGVFSAHVDWGYFSNKDGEMHQVDLCEDCYDKWIAHFAISIDVVSKTEML